jgi:hypothetical protein
MRISEVTQQPNMTPVARGVQSAVRGEVRDLAKSALQSIVVSRLPQILESTALKSIPGIGILVGLYYAGQSVSRGDWVDSLLNLASGFTSVAGSLGIAAYQAARNLYQAAYNTVFEQDAATDPTGAQRRIQSLSDTVLQELQKWINQALQAARAQAKKSMTSPVSQKMGLHI